MAQLIRMAFIDPKRVTAYIEGSAPIRLASAEIAGGIGIPMSWQSQLKACSYQRPSVLTAMRSLAHSD